MTIIKSANEILTTMAERLKFASVVDEFKNDLAKAKTEEQVDAVCKKYKRPLLYEGVDAEALCNSRKGKIKKEKDSAMGFAMRKIIEAADMLDRYGFNDYANNIDSLIEKITSKK